MSEMAFPKIEGYVVTEKLGSGSYSTVYKAYTKVGGRQVVAIKCVDKARVRGAAADNLLTEIRLLKTLQHPHIVAMHHFTWDHKSIYIIMEYCCGGDLSKYIQRYGRVPEKQVLYFLQQLASALKFLREKGVVHMDLKPHNLLLQRDSDGRRTLKLADFGFASVLEANAEAMRGSPLYMAPEMLAGRYDARVDLWSVGVIMFECLFGFAPYRSSSLQQLVAKLARHAPIEIPPNSSISAGCRDLLTRLLKHDPDQRISYEEFFAHPYLDLEHMPSKENYEKAVSLIKQAIELDGAGNLKAAFEAYKDSLLYLVPAVAAETDAVRKSALTAKLTRYMERAEEIKQYLREPEGTGPPRLPGTGLPRRQSLVTCCTNPALASSHRDFTQYRAACSTAVNNNNGLQDTGTVEQSAIVEPEPSEPSEHNKHFEPSEQSEPTKKPRLLRRLFSRNPVPFLDTKDSTVAIEAPSGNTRDNSDACRIA